MTNVRLCRAWKALHPNADSAFDPDEPLHVDELACVLLERYRSAGDAEAFALLFELTRPQLLRLASTLLEPQAAPIHATSDGARDRDRPGNRERAKGLVLALMRSMHCEGRSAPPRLSGFPVLAAGRMRGLLAEAGRDRPHPLQTSPLARSA